MPRRVFPVRGRRVFVAGHRGMVGAAIVRALVRAGAGVLTAPWPGVDLRRQAETEAWLADARPDAVVLAAAETPLRPLWRHRRTAVSRALREGRTRA